MLFSSVCAISSLKLSGLEVFSFMNNYDDGFSVT